MLISIIIPVLNEEKSIKEVVTKVLAQKSVGEIIIVNDGSTDSTPEIIEKLKNKKVKVLNHSTNQGKGKAIRTGLNAVTMEYLLIQDADLEYNPNEYVNLIKKVDKNTVVYGSRLKKDNKYAYNRTYLGNVVLTKLSNFLYGINLTDSYTCYKLIPTKVMKNLNLYSNGFEIEAEITAKLAKHKVKIIEVPISYIPRKYEDGKKIKALDAIKGIITLCKEKLSLS